MKAAITSIFSLGDLKKIVTGTKLLLFKSHVGQHLFFHLSGQLHIRDEIPKSDRNPVQAPFERGPETSSRPHRHRVLLGRPLQEGWVFGQSVDRMLQLKEGTHHLREIVVQDSVLILGQRVRRYKR